MADTHTHIYKHPCTRLISLAQTHIHLGARLSWALLRGFHYIHTQVSIYWRYSWCWQTYIHIRILTLDCLQKHTCTTWLLRTSMTLAETFSLHAGSVTHNLHTYFTSVGQVFLVEMIVLQTVLWDIWALSASFLFLIYFLATELHITIFRTVQEDQLFH